ncbi:hypothetical protein NKH77_12195 [Streptomyces sp. M19]
MTYAGSSAVVAFAAGVFLLTLNVWGPRTASCTGPCTASGSSSPWWPGRC